MKKFLASSTFSTETIRKNTTVSSMFYSGYCVIFFALLFLNNVETKNKFRKYHPQAHIQFGDIVTKARLYSFIAFLKLNQSNKIFMFIISELKYYLFIILQHTSRLHSIMCYVNSVSISVVN